VLLTLPLDSATAADAQLALLEMQIHTLARGPAALADVLDAAPTVLLASLGDALRIAQSAARAQVELVDCPLRLLVVTTEPGGSLEVTRRLLEGHWGAACLDVYALTELGVIGWGCAARGNGIHLDDLSLELRAVDPDSGERVGDGQLGELVLSTPANWGTPLADFRTGDLLRVRHAACACGRGSVWAEGGVLGRVTDRLPVRGQVILPSTIEQSARRHLAVVDFALRAYELRGECEVMVQLEVTDAVASEGDRARVAAEVAEDLRRSLGIRLHCDVVAPGAISSTHVAGRRAQRLTRQ
jgi:phenylacetate-CoA ligase